MNTVRVCNRCLQEFAPNDTINDMLLIANGKQFNVQVCTMCKQVILDSWIAQNKDK
jgi:hypothetical protein